jgi:hypothetical protein
MPHQRGRPFLGPFQAPLVLLCEKTCPFMWDALHLSLGRLSDSNAIALKPALGLAVHSVGWGLLISIGNKWKVSMLPGNWCQAMGGQRGRSREPCQVSLPQQASPASAGVAAAPARGEPGRWGRAGEGHLMSKSFIE